MVGAAGSIGRKLAETLHRDGASLFLGGRNTAALDEVATTCGGQAASMRGTLDAVDAVFQAYPCITGAVNLAGSILLKPAHWTTIQYFDETIALNLRTAFVLTRAAGEHLKSTGESVVLMSSCAAGIGLPNHEAIAAAKAGVEGLVRSAVATYAGSGSASMRSRWGSSPRRWPGESPRTRVPRRRRRPCIRWAHRAARGDRPSDRVPVGHRGAHGRQGRCWEWTAASPA